MRYSLKLQSGFGLVEVMIVAGIVSIILAAVTISVSNVTRSGSKIDTSMDITVIKSRLMESVSCAKSLAFSAPPCAVGSYIPLLNANGNVVIDANGTAYGKFTLRAQCLVNGIDVRAAWLTPAGQSATGAKNFMATNPDWFRRDEVSSNLRYDWSHPKSRIFAVGTSAAALCPDMFGGAPSATSCAPHQYVKGVNFITKNVVCADIPTCAANQFLQWNGAQFLCTTVGGGVTRVVSASATVYRFVGATATCNADEVVVGGGGNCTQPTGAIWVNESSPSGNGWYVHCDGGLANQMATANVYAVCLKK